MANLATPANGPEDDPHRRTPAETIANDIKGSMDIYSISAAASMDRSGSLKGSRGSLDKHESVLTDSPVRLNGRNQGIASFPSAKLACPRPALPLLSTFPPSQYTPMPRSLTPHTSSPRPICSTLSHSALSHPFPNQICLPLNLSHFRALERILERRETAVVFVDCRPTLSGTERRING